MYLSKIRTTPRYYLLKTGTYNFLKKIPLLGRPVAKFIRNLKKIELILSQANVSATTSILLALMSLFGIEVLSIRQIFRVQAAL